jgi:Domain of unknown function (DUF5753)
MSLRPDTMMSRRCRQVVIVDVPPGKGEPAHRPTADHVGLRLQRQAEVARREPRPRRNYVIDEAVIHRRIGIANDLAIMPDLLRDIADKAEQDDLITVRVIPFFAGAHRGLSGPFTLLEFDGGLPDVLYIDAGRREFASMVIGNEPQVAEYRDDFELLLEDPMSAEKISSAHAESSG